MVACSDFLDATSVDCSQPWGPNCTEKAGFEPHRLWNITLNIWSRCPNDSRLWQEGLHQSTNSSASLSNRACEAITGPYLNRLLKATKYGNQDIWGRLATWKFPLFQLVASSPRPPLGSWVEGFVIAHLMGDPIGTMRDSLRKVNRCQHHVDYWTDTFSDGVGWLSETQRKREIRAFALITLSYDDWGKGDEVQGLLRDALDHYVLRAFIEQLHRNLGPEVTFDDVANRLKARKVDGYLSKSKHSSHGQRFLLAFERVIRQRKEAEVKALQEAEEKAVKESLETSGQASSQTLQPTPKIQLPKFPERQRLATFFRLCNQTSDALAADRATKFLPILVAQSFFIGAIAVALVKTVSDNGATLLINVEAHSIAFSALYFWIIPAVSLNSIIGVSQTENSMPAILHNFRVHLKRELEDYTIDLPGWTTLDNTPRRVANGVIFSWLPRELDNYQRSLTKVPRGALMRIASEAFNFIEKCLPGIVVAGGTLTAMLVSYFVPPKGWEARHCSQASFFFTWLISFTLTELFKKALSPKLGNKSWLFKLTYVKDIIFGGGVVAGIIVTQIGVFNRCLSYTRWNRTGLMLPDQPDTEEWLKHSIHSIYIAITVIGIGLQMFLPSIYVWWKYRTACSILLQRDDEKGNIRLPRHPWSHQSQGDESKDLLLSSNLEERTFGKSNVGTEGPDGMINLPSVGGLDDDSPLLERSFSRQLRQRDD